LDSTPDDHQQNSSSYKAGGYQDEATNSSQIQMDQRQKPEEKKEGIPGLTPSTAQNQMHGLDGLTPQTHQGGSSFYHQQ